MTKLYFALILAIAIATIQIQLVYSSTIEIPTYDPPMTLESEILVLVDAPEINELGYNEAKDFVSQNCLDKPATVDPDNNQDLSYGRLVALVYCDGLNINEAIIAQVLLTFTRVFVEYLNLESVIGHRTMAVVLTMSIYLIVKFLRTPM